ncbi:hypothetical protein D3C80_1720180 [compost metagenome]
MLFDGQGFVGQVGAQRFAEVVGLGQVAAVELADELLEVRRVGAVVGLDDGRRLLLGEVGLGRHAEQADTGQQQ